MLDPTHMMPRAGAGDPATGGIAISIRPPESFNLIQGALPGTVSFTPTDYQAGRIEADGRKQGLIRQTGGSIAVFGDSNIDGLDLSSIPYACNYGISGDTIEGLIHRLRSGVYTSLTRARAIVLASIPINNLNTSSPNIPAIEALYAEVLDYFTGPLVIVPPTRTTVSAYNTSIATFNSWLIPACAGRDQCVVIDVSDLQTAEGAVLPGYTLDYVHWAPTMQRIILDRTKAALRAV